MKIWIVSGLHLEFGRPFNQTPPDGIDVMVCAGDLLTKGIGPSIEWLANNIAHVIPVVRDGHTSLPRQAVERVLVAFDLVALDAAVDDRKVDSGAAARHL